MTGLFKSGEVISYTEMCSVVGASLQRGMNFRLVGLDSVILMSRRANAPYVDRIEGDGRTLVYEGHDQPKNMDGPYSKEVDQPEYFPGGSPTQNGLFAESVRRHKAGEAPELVHVFEKIHAGIWVYNGLFELIDYRLEKAGGRNVFKFKLRLSYADNLQWPEQQAQNEEDRVIPSKTKLEVWKRDQGRCRICGTDKGLHFDHIIPYSKGGSSKDPANIQILCGRHNLAKRDKIE